MQFKQLYAFLFVFTVSITFSLNVRAQSFSAVGDAIQTSCNCFELTSVDYWENGAIWYVKKLNIQDTIDLVLPVFLGSLTSDGADGIAFALQQDGLNYGTAGFGIGIGGISPAFIVEIDTWRNGYDPTYDHLSVYRDGNVDHTNAGTRISGTGGGSTSVYVPAKVDGGGNAMEIEDGAWHEFHFVWNPNEGPNGHYYVYFDDSLRISQDYDIRPIFTDVAMGDSVWWGMASATGGARNLHMFCNDITSDFLIDVPYTACFGELIYFQDSSYSTLNDIVSWEWDFGDGSPIEIYTADSATQSPTHEYLAPGLYSATLTVTDIGGCSNTVTNAVRVYEPINVTLDTTRVECRNNDNAIAWFDTSGFDIEVYWIDMDAVPVDTFAFANAVNPNDVDTVFNLSPGNYRFVAKRPNNYCDTVIDFYISNPDQIIVTVQSNTVLHETACGLGEAVVNAIGGTPPYTYSWSPSGGTDSVATGLTGTTAGLEYKITVTDDRGCEYLGDSVVIYKRDSMVIDVVDSTNVLCNGDSTGTITINVSGGTPPFTYLWDDPAASTDSAISNLPAGTYTVTVTDSTACSVVGQVTIIEPAALNVIVVNSQDPTCSEDNGELFVGVSGGYSPYTFDWDDPLNQNTAVADSLPAGSYTVIVVDSVGCSDTLSGLVMIPIPDLVIDSTTHANVSCFGGNDGFATVYPNPLSQPFTYLWLPSGQTDSSATGLNAGQDSVYITDANGCDTTLFFVITQPTDLSLSASTTTENCDSADGTATVSVIGGISPYSYLWSSGDPDTSFIDSLTAGNYKVVVTDSNNCVDSINVTINAINNLTAVIFKLSDVDCYGDSTGGLRVVASGGNPYTTTGTEPYTYIWSPTPPLPGPGNDTVLNLHNERFTVQVRDSTNCAFTVSDTIYQPDSLAANLAITSNYNGEHISCVGANDAQITSTTSGGTASYTYVWDGVVGAATKINQTPGWHVLELTDDNACTLTDSIEVFNPDTLTTLLTDTTHILCNGDATGEAIVTPTGGTVVSGADYTYIWSPSLVTDSTNPSLTAATYTVITTDLNGCQSYDTITINEPSALTLNLTTQTAHCDSNNGQITATPAGGVAPYTYLWDDPSTQTDSIADSLDNQLYVVLVTDANGCTISDSAQTGRVANFQPAFNSVTHVSCNSYANGSIIVVTSGGQSPFNHLWNSGSTTSSISSLAPGLYVDTVTDNLGCIRIIDTTITEPAVLMANVSVLSNYGGEDISCFGFSNGRLRSIPTGGTTPYRYDWAHIAGTNNPATVSGLPVGTYQLIVRDNNGCRDTVFPVLTQPLPITTSINFAPLLCNGDSTMVDLTASGGTGNLRYLWLPLIVATEDLALVPAGTYRVIVIDSNNCIARDTAFVTQPAAMNFSTATLSSTCGFDNGEAFVNGITGGTGPFDTLWTNTLFTDSLIDTLVSGAGSYTVTIRDANLCRRSAVVNILDALAPSVSITFIQEVTCKDSATGMIVVDTLGGLQPITILWNTGSTNDTLFNVPAGNYSVTITDATPCVASADTVLTEPAFSIGAANITIDDALCFGDANGVVYAEGNGGMPWTRSDTLPYQYTWSAGNFSSDPLLWDSASGLAAGALTITITDSLGCWFDTIVTVGQPTQLSLTATHTDVDCYSDSTGDISVTVSGGTPIYNYIWFHLDGVYDTINGESDSGISIRPAGRDSLVATDANGCTIDTAITIIENNRITISLDSISPEYCNRNDGWIAISVIGGAPNPGFNYNWSHPINGSSSVAGFVETVDTLIAADSSMNEVYTVVVTDTLGCTSDTTFIVGFVGGPTVSITDVVNDSCRGSLTGRLIASGSTGILPYIYQWNDLANTLNDTLDNIGAGNYQITVTDANNCSAVVNQTITQPAFKLAASSIFASPALCKDSSSGYAVVTGTGGTPFSNPSRSFPYDVVWSAGTTLVRPDSVFNLSAALYTVTIRDSMNCELLDSNFTITEPNQLLVSSDSVNVNCYGDFTGSATAYPSAGTSPYFYAWNDAASQIGVTASGLPADTFIITVTDFNGCVMSDTVEVTQNPIIQIASTIITPEYCQNLDPDGINGSIKINVNGGSPSGIYTYNWTHPVNGGVGSTDSVIGLDSSAAEYYYVYINDDLGCLYTDSFNVGYVPPLTIDSFVVIPADCYDSLSSSAEVFTQGTPVASYQWNSVPVQNTKVANNLHAGNYIVTVTDTNGCTLTADTTTYEEADIVSAIVAFKDVSCHGGSDGAATAIVVGGVTGTTYTYEWYNPLLSTNNDTVFNLDATTTAMLIVKDNNGCVDTNYVLANEPDTLVGAFNFDSVSCSGLNTGKAWISVAPGNTGTPPYSFNWTPGGSTIDTAFGLFAQSYVAIMTDDNGCKDTISGNVLEPNPLVLTFTSVRDMRCHNDPTGAIITSVSGGTTPYSHRWNSGDVTANIILKDSGLYVDTVIDRYDCRAIKSDYIIAPDSIRISLSKISDDHCGVGHGKVAASVTGGSGNLSFSWAPTIGAGIVNTESVYDSLIANPNPTLYTVTVTDDSLCVSNANISVDSISGGIVLMDNVVNNKCINDAEGSVFGSVSGNWNNPKYTWTRVSDGNKVGFGLFASGLVAGNYLLTVVDDYGCTASEDTTVTEPPYDFQISGSSTPISCFQAMDATAQVTYSPPAAVGVVYDWKGLDSITSSVSGLGPYLPYNVHVTDGYGCVRDTAFIFTEPMLLVVSLIEPVTIDPDDYNVTPIDWATCYGYNDAEIRAYGVGGQGSGQYLITVWDTLSGTQVLSTTVVAPDTLETINLSAGGYRVEITNGDGSCYSEVNRFVAEPELIDVSDELTTDTALCSGDSVAVDLLELWQTPDSNYGGRGTYTYHWTDINNVLINNGQDLMLASGDSGYYVLHLEDSYGCTGSDTSYVVIHKLPDPIAYTDPNPKCVFTDLFFFDSTDQTNTDSRIQQWLWTFGDGNTSAAQNPIHGYSKAGDYAISLSVTDQFGCSNMVDSILSIYVDAAPSPGFSYDVQEDLVGTSYFFDESTGERVSSWLWRFDEIIDGDTISRDTFMVKDPNYMFEYDHNEGTEYRVRLIVSSSKGCLDSTEQFLEVILDDIIYIPNTFTPNGDGVNDVFIPRGEYIDYANSEMVIYNRWGQDIFHISNLYEGWDGSTDWSDRVSQDGVYTYIIKVADFKGATQVYYGSVNLLK